MLAFFLVLCLIAVGASATDTGVSPVQKVVQLLSDLEAEVNKEGLAATAIHEDFKAWCEDRAKNLQYEIKTDQTDVADLNAAIEHAVASIGGLNAKIEEKSAKAATDEADLKTATDLRSKEKSDFVAEEQNLVEVISMLERAVNILQREVRKGGAAMVQLQKASSIMHALGIMVEASMLPSQDAAKLTSLVQNSEQDVNAPDVASYQSHSGSIITTFENLLEQAQSQLADARQKEAASTQNFQMLKQSLEDSIKFAGQAVTDAKKDFASQVGLKANAAGDLAVTSKTMAEGQKTLSILDHDCTTETEDFEAEKNSRNKELQALAEAKQVITEMTGGAETNSYSLRQMSLMQLVQSGLKTSVDLVNFEVVQFVRKLAQRQHSEELAQLGRRMASAIRGATTGGYDRFSKVKGMIIDVIKRLEDDAKSDAAHKTWCDEQLGDTKEKKEDRETLLNKLTNQIDTMSARSAKLKEQVADLQKALASVAKAQAEMHMLRQGQHKQYLYDKVEMEEGLEGIKIALKRLREYYYAGEDKAHAAATGSASGIIGLLEVIEADFTKTFSEMTATEKASQADFEQGIKENEIEKTTKDQDVSYKNREIAQLTNAIAGTTSDKQGTQAELNAILEYNGQLLKACKQKSEAYGARTERREAEIAGLKEALSILEGEAALLQRGGVTRQQRVLRGVSLGIGSA